MSAVLPPPTILKVTLACLGTPFGDARGTISSYATFDFQVVNTWAVKAGDPFSLRFTSFEDLAATPPGEDLELNYEIFVNRVLMPDLAE